MKNVRLKALKLRNFKGIRELDIDFNGLDTNIYGKNATGKTTIVDAFQWLFFNKNSSGSADFDIKTKTSDGEYLHNLEHSVECSVVVDETEMLFKKIFKEKYTKQRGSTTATFTGHTTDYFVDDVPRKKKEYDDTVNELFNNDIFPMITDPFYFNTRMKWQDRRKMLIDICGDVSDELIISSNKYLVPLSQYLSNKSVDDLRAQLKSQMKPINEELKAIPIKINEAQLAIPTCIEEFDEEKYNFINDKINDLYAKKQRALSGGAVADKETELINFKNKKLLIENEVPDTKKLKNELYESQIQFDSLKNDIERLKSDIQANKSMQKSNELKRDELREKYLEINAMTYDEKQNICPHCGQDLPPEQIAGFMERFNVSKSKRLEDINHEGISLKKEFDERESHLVLLEQEIETKKAVIKDVERIIGDKKKEIDNFQESFRVEQEPKIQSINVQIADVEREIQDLTSNVVDLVNQYDKEIKTLKEEKDILDAIIIRTKVAESQKNRIKELETREKELSKEYTRREQLLYLTDLFVKEKVNMLTEKINSHFKVCSFKLFEEQINGGLNEACEVMVNGVNYPDLNNAMKINAGLDVINTICDYSDTYAPIFIDNAESVNKTLETSSQQIGLYVTETDEKLRIENK